MKCPKCDVDAPDGDEYCGKCGAALRPKDSPPPPATMQIDDYVKFLGDMNQKHFDFLRRTLHIGAAIFTIYAGAIGLGTFFGVEARLQTMLDVRLEHPKMKEKVNGLLDTALDAKIKDKFGPRIEIFAQNAVDKVDTRLSREKGYLYIQIARAIFDDRKPARKDGGAVRSWFLKAIDELSYESRKQGGKNSSIWFELGRLHYDYAEEYPIFADKDVKEDYPIVDRRLRDARGYHRLAIKHYNDNVRSKYELEPTYYVAQISMKLYLNGTTPTEKGSLKATAKIDLEGLITALLNHRKPEFVKTYKQKVESLRAALSNENEDALNEFASNLYFMDFRPSWTRGSVN